MIEAFIDGKRVKIDPTHTGIQEYDGRMELVIESGEEYVLFENTEAAGQAAKEDWKDMAYNDPKEFECIIGAETLIAWCLGQSAGPGNMAVSSLEEWFDLTATIPEEKWASYDGIEREFKCEYSDFEKYTVAYRIN